MREIFLQTPLRPDSPYRLAPLVFLFVGEKGAPAAKEKGTGIA
jgi:hypothetical protein